MFRRYIDGQYRRPTGIVGRWIGSRMAKQHQPENHWTVAQLDIQPNDHVLELGFGPGIAVAEVARRAEFVAGIDFSKTMVQAARRRNRQAVRGGRVDVRHGNVVALPFSDGAFDKAYSIHSIYFWPDPIQALREVRRVLKPGGKIVLTVLPKEKWGSDGTPECKPYTGTTLEAMLQNAGFAQTWIQADAEGSCPSNYSVIGRT